MRLRAFFLSLRKPSENTNAGQTPLSNANTVLKKKRGRSDAPGHYPTNSVVPKIYYVLRILTTTPN
jgi:hypothetical protein